jgi:UDP-glucose 4-epimerase
MSNRLKDVNSEILNLGTNEQTTVKEVAEYILSKTNSKSKINFIERKKIFGDYEEILVRFANISKAEKLINFKISNMTFDVIDKMIYEFSNPNSEHYIK